MGILPENNETEWPIIYGLEGFTLEGFVPKRNAKTVAGHSGVTIAHGFDLGQQTDKTLKQLTAYGLTEELSTKLEPYAGKSGPAAVKFLKNHPLSLTAGEGKVLDAAVKKMETARVIKFYEKQVAKNPDPDSIKYQHFSDLPSNAKTVVASLYYQRGGNAARFHTLLQDIQKGDFRAAAKEMREDIIPQSKYPGRREAEAKLLDEIVTPQQPHNPSLLVEQVTPKQPHKAALLASNGQWQKTVPAGKKVKLPTDAPTQKASLTGGRSCDAIQGCDRNGVPLKESYATAKPYENNFNFVVVNVSSP